MTDLAGTISALGTLAPLVAAFTALFVAVRAQRALEDTKAAIVQTKDGVYLLGKQVDGRLTELLETTRALARAEGVAVGEQNQRDRAADPQK